MPTDSAEAAAPHADVVRFRDLSLSAPVLKALEEVGYESPSPIQAATIPHLLAGRDVLGQAQTGTGKTAAFALPILSELRPEVDRVQALVLVPTRELAIQVAEAFQKYANQMPGFHVLPIYGGQSYEPQLARLRRGVHVVVGTPGRVMDHMKRGTLKLEGLRHLVLDEADEMLRMGFIDDVAWVLEQTPPGRQVALFSATMPPPIRKIAQRHLKDPAEITIRSKTSTATNIRQRYFLLGGFHKLDALTRILEAEQFDGMLIFTRTKQATTELAERLEARGYAAAALNGDIPQALRERTIARLKAGQLDIVVATDVAARGLDVERISHVVNFDIPYDVESYVHRIGRTGRAGRSGEAILFVTYRERNMLRVIERATRQSITPMEMPTAEAVNDLRIARFMQKITEARALPEMGTFQALVEQYAQEQQVPMEEVAAALAVLAQGGTPFLLDTERSRAPAEKPAARPAPAAAPAAPVAAQPAREQPESPEEADRAERPRPERKERRERAERPAASAERSARPERHEPRERMEHPASGAERPERKPRGKRERDGQPRMETYRLAVGKVHRVKPANIVGAIINEAGLDGKLIGHIDIQEDYSLVDLPEGMPKEIFRDLQKVWVAGQQLKISKVGDTRGAFAQERSEGPHERTHERPDDRPPGRFAPRPPKSFAKPFAKSFDRPPGRPFGKPTGKSGKPFGKSFAKGGVKPGKRPPRDR